MKEKFEDRVLSGPINIKCKNDDGTYRMWSTQKEIVVQHIIQTVRRYQEMGYRLTLRQLHYQLVTKNWIVNHDTAYKKLGDILDDCRYAGLIDWDAIEDRGRLPHLVYDADGVPEALEELHDYYRRDRQDGQKNVVEVWTEKDALSGILKRPAEKYHVRLVINKGYTSSSAAYRAYMRVLEAINAGKTFTILYFGDHDPSGLDMVRDIEERLLKFLSLGHQLRENDAFLDAVQKDWDDMSRTIHDLWQEDLLSEQLVKKILDGTGDEDKNYLAFEAAKIASYIKRSEIFRVVGIGLTMEQIEEYGLPPNPSKMTDPRAVEYVRKFGRTCWEVDALDPEVLDDLVTGHIEREIRMDKYFQMIKLENADKDLIRSFIDKNTSK